MSCAVEEPIRFFGIDCSILARVIVRCAVTKQRWARPVATEREEKVIGSSIGRAKPSENTIPGCMTSAAKSAFCPGSVAMLMRSWKMLCAQRTNRCSKKGYK